MEDNPQQTETPAMTCPECGAPSRPIVFGYPAPAASRAAEAGEMELGGCLLPREDERIDAYCLRGHGWRAGGDRREEFLAWVRSILARHGQRHFFA